MRFRPLALVAAVLSLAATPVAAEAVRASATVQNASELEGNSDVFLVLGAAAIIAAIVIATSSGDDDPISG